MHLQKKHTDLQESFKLMLKKSIDETKSIKEVCVW